MPLPGGNDHPIWTSSNNKDDVQNLGQGVIRPDTDTAFSVSELTNPGGAAEGSNLPPQQRGSYRVPIPMGFKVQGNVFNPSTLATTFTLVWNDITDNTNGLNQTMVVGYRVYAQYQENLPEQGNLVGSSSGSPCNVVITLPLPAGGVTLRVVTVTFWLQPFLANGLTLPLEACPTCTGQTQPPYFQLFDGVTTVYISGGVNAGHGGTAPGFEIYNLPAQFSWFLDSSKHGGILMTNSIGNDAVFLGTSTGTNAGIMTLSNGTGTGGLDTGGGTVQLDANLGRLNLFHTGGGGPTILLTNGTAGQDVVFTQVTAATASAGASTLPATPEGFLEITIGGTIKKIPYYAT